MSEEDFSRRLVELQPKLHKYSRYIEFSVLQKQVPTTAKDLVQDINYRALKFQHHYTGEPEHLLHWLMTMMKREAYKKVTSSAAKVKFHSVDSVLGATESATAGDWEPNAFDKLLHISSFLESVSNPHALLEAKEAKQSADVLAKQVHAAIEALPEDNAICVLYSLEGKPTIEASEDLGISDVLFRWRTYRGRKELRKTLKDLYECQRLPK